MNATTFFSEQTFLRLKEDIAQQKEFHLTETPYQKKVRINGNSYELEISAYVNPYTNLYQITCWINYNYPGLYQSRNIGGGNYPRINLDNYEAFKESINKTLSRFPDYKEEEQPLQFSIAF